MAINPVRNGAITQIAVNPQGAAQQRAQRSSSERSTEAMKVELSPAARRAGAESAVTAANKQSASSADYFASPEGQRQLASMLPKGRTAVAV
jgi:hypothetical protein